MHEPAHPGRLAAPPHADVGLHPLDARTLLNVTQRLLDQGATAIVVEHDLDMVANADHIVDRGPGGGAADGTVVATGTSTV
ncbi:hypothetical protein [Promicromonospora sp. NPDC050249]|uniref:hypothetical protein n=1 Tax=Promicromonospora sp. NPDC050249 TaxID=3154743 RepID=UPI003409DD3F